MKKIVLMILVGLTLHSCQKNDGLTVDDSVNKSENTPVYTFDV